MVLVNVPNIATVTVCIVQAEITVRVGSVIPASQQG